MNPSAPHSNSYSRHVVMLATGGTIAGSALAVNHPQPGVYKAAQLSVQQLLVQSGIERHLIFQQWRAQGYVLEAEQVAQVDSKDMTQAIWLALAHSVQHHLQRPEVAGVVITHGTDTLEETAVFLQQVLAPAKPVVLTAAMRPSDDLWADGPQNLLDALVVASSDLRGVLAVMNGCVYAGAEVRKWHPWVVDAFGAVPAGPMARVHQGQLSVYRACTDAGVLALGLALLPPPEQPWPWVEVLASYAACSARALQCLVDTGVQGVVLSATGNGTLHECLEQTVGEYLAQGRLHLNQVLVATRCAMGGVVGQPSHGFPTAGNLTPAQARVVLMLNLMQCGDS